MITWPDGYSRFPIETDGTDVLPVLREFFDAVEALDKKKTVEMMHENCICEYPTRSIGVPERLEGRDAFEKYEEMSFTVPDRTMDNFIVYNLGHPSWCVLTHSLDHTFPWEGGNFKSEISSIFGAHEGKLIYMREYFDSAALDRALDRAPDKYRQHGPKD